jgi:predicted nucleic acid-binding protein
MVPQDVHHAASRQWLEGRLSWQEMLVAPVLLLAEVAGAIARRTGQPMHAHRATSSLTRLSTLRLVAVTGRLGLASARLAADCRIPGTDATYVAVAHALHVPLVTWDRQQRERAARLVVTQTPGPIVS